MGFSTPAETDFLLPADPRTVQKHGLKLARLGVRLLIHFGAATLTSSSSSCLRCTGLALPNFFSGIPR